MTEQQIEERLHELAQEIGQRRSESDRLIVKLAVIQATRLLKQTAAAAACTCRRTPLGCYPEYTLRQGCPLHDPAPL